jgi:hypothetical protein
MLSFAATTPQILARTKTVTRRLGWRFIVAGDVVQAIEKGQGLRKGERVRRLAVLEVVSVRREPLRAITAEDVEREGFPGMSAEWFVDFFCRLNGCTPDTEVTRIAFRYLDSKPEEIEKMLIERRRVVAADKERERRKAVSAARLGWELF